MQITFLGLGRMGVALATHVAKHPDHALTVWNRTPGKAGDLVALGATEASSIEEAVRDADVVVLVLFGPDAVREVLPQVTAGTTSALVLDVSTNGPEAAREFAAGPLRYVDAPVAGSIGPATKGELGVFLGGSDEDVATVRPLVELWGDPQRIKHVGPVGSASAVKLCVNQGLGVMAAGVGESLRLGSSLGLDREVLLDALGSTAYGWYLGQKRDMVGSGDYSGTTFSVELLAKDLGLALHEAQGDLQVTRAALDQAERTLDAGHSGEDYAAITGHLADEGEASSY